MKKAIQTFSTIVTAVTFLCIVIAAIFILPKAAGFTPYIVESGSMEPTIHTGTIAFIDTKDRDVAAGDVVTYRIGTEEKKQTGYAQNHSRRRWSFHHKRRCQ